MVVLITLLLYVTRETVNFQKLPTLSMER